MRIIRCHIENFGRLSDFSYDFSAGCNIICEENGWGKSTLAAFIRVMLYGFCNETKRDALENERKRYKPWQKGTYGGELAFEAGGTGYLVRRVFGAKSAEDEFLLTRLDTNLPCEDFSAQLGEELFHIDAESFARTVFLSQNDCESHTTDSINAKIGNLAENTDDLNNYETADKRIGELLNAMTPSRKTGSFNRLNSRITQLTAEIRKGQELEATMREVAARKKACEQEREQCAAEQKQLQEKQNELGVYKDLKAKHDMYVRLLQESDRRKEEQKAAEDAFHGVIPQEDELNRMLRTVHEAEKLRGTMDVCRLTPEENAALERLRACFEGHVLPEDEAQRYITQAQEYDTVKAEVLRRQLSEGEKERLEQLAAQYGEHPADLSQTAQIREVFRDYRDKKHDMDMRKTALRTAEAMTGRQRDAQQKAGKTKRRGQILFFAGVLVLLAGVLLLLLEQTPGAAGMLIAVGIVVAGIVMGAAGAFVARGAKAGAAAQPEDVLTPQRQELAAVREEVCGLEEELEAFCESLGFSFQEDDFVSHVVRLQRDMQDYGTLLAKRNRLLESGLPERLKEMRSSLERFIASYGAAGAGGSYLAAVNNIRQEADTYERLRTKAQHYAKQEEIYLAKTAEIRKYMEAQRLEQGSDPEETLGALSVRLQELNGKRQEAQRAQEALEQFAGQTDVERLSSLRQPETEQSMEELSKRQEQLTARTEELFGQIQSYSGRLLQLEEAWEELREQEAELAQLKEQAETDSRTYALLKTTRELLETAKSAFTAKYTEPIMSGFRKYYRLLSGQGGEALQMDANTRLHVIEQNLPREVAALSPGRQDLIGVCMRMALVEAMYQSEKPFLVMDDPFVNLDEERMRGGMAFLGEVSKEYQIIYFTCHTSRSLQQ